METSGSPELPAGDDATDEQSSDRSQTSAPPAVALPAPRRKTDREVRERAEAARQRDPTAGTGQAG